MKNLLLLLFLIGGLMTGCSKSDKNTPDSGDGQEVDNGSKDSSEQESPEAKTYDQVILKDDPVGYWMLNEDHIDDAGANEIEGTWHGEVSSSQSTELPNGENARGFNGTDAYYEIPDVDHLELINKGILTIEAWMSPSVADFPNVEEGKDYIHWMGKGEPGQHSWAARMYNEDSWRENRPQRISGYAFNLEGGLGAGSYFQDPVDVENREWIHFVLVINTKKQTSKFPTGYTAIYKNGLKQDQDALDSYKIVPGDGTAPTRIGTRDMGSFFKGAIAKVAIYDYELSTKQIMEHFKAMK